MEHSFAYLLGQGFVPALLAAAATYFLLPKQNPGLSGSSKGWATFVAGMVAWITFVSTISILQSTNPETAARFGQPMLIISALVGYLLAKVLAPKRTTP